MHENTSPQELKERLNLIERMMAEGRRHTESWGWTFVLWGAVFYIAIAWSARNGSIWAWPVTVLIAMVLTFLVASLRARNDARTTLGRAIGSIWIALAISMFLVFLALGFSGRLTDQHLFMSVTSAMLGMANGASGILLRWKAQLACAVVWWATAVVTCFGSNGQSTVVFLVAIFLCQILFGLYGMIADAQARKRHGRVHA